MLGGRNGFPVKKNPTSILPKLTVFLALGKPVGRKGGLNWGKYAKPSERKIAKANFSVKLLRRKISEKRLWNAFPKLSEV